MEVSRRFGGFATPVSKETESWPRVAEKETICKSEVLCN